VLKFYLCLDRRDKSKNTPRNAVHQVGPHPCHIIPDIVDDSSRRQDFIVISFSIFRGLWTFQIQSGNYKVFIPEPVLREHCMDSNWPSNFDKETTRVLGTEWRIWVNLVFFHLKRALISHSSLQHLDQTCEGRGEKKVGKYLQSSRAGFDPSW
jgi:hypothetical protein